MHSLGYRVIRENIGLLDLAVVPTVVHADRTRRMLMCDAAQLAGYRREDADETRSCRQFGQCRPDDSQKCKICTTYGAILRSCGAIDYDDQILLACRILRDHPDVAQSFQERSRHLLVDEYQDINAGQFELIRALSRGHDSGLFVVGDDDQSIYSWRGGSPEFIRRFEKHFGGAAKVVPLQRSYRCPRTILESAFAVVREYDKERRDKGSFTYHVGDCDPIEIHSVASDRKEAALIRRVVADSLPSKDVLILVPNRNYARAICSALRRSRIAFVAPEPLPGQGLPVIERFISWVEDPHDSLALRECIENMLSAEGSPVPSNRVRKHDKRQARENSFAVVSSLWREVIKGDVSLLQVLSQDGRDDEVLGYLWECLEALRSSVDAREVPGVLSCIAEHLRPWRSVDDLAGEVRNWVGRLDRGGPPEPCRVRVMTFQGAKGLEADVVCIVGAEEGAIPRDPDKSEELPEQARLFFVSVTRAKRELHVFHARTRSGGVSYRQLHKAGGPHTLERSRFIGALPGNLACSSYHPPSKK